MRIIPDTYKAIRSVAKKIDIGENEVYKWLLDNKYINTSGFPTEKAFKDKLVKFNSTILN